MPLVKITRNRQVTIPKTLFEALALRRGDYVELVREGDRLIITPKVLTDRTRAKAEVKEILARIWKRNRALDSAEVEAVIAQELQEMRREKHRESRRHPASR